MSYLKKYFHLQILAAVIFFAAYPAFTQNSVILPRVGVAPIGMSDKENIQLNIISERVRDSAVLVLRYLDNYELGRNALPEPSAYDNETLLQYCERENLDSLVYGKTYKRGDDSFIIEMSVFNRESGKTTVTRMEKAETALEIFEAADNATYSLIKGFSGRRIAFGRIAVKLTGEKGVYVPYLDGEEYPVNTETFDRILTGERKLEIYQTRMLGNVKIFETTLEVPEGEAALAEIEIPYLLSEEEDLINEQAEIIERYSDKSIKKPKERKKVAEAYSRIDNLLVRTDYNEGLTLLKEQYRQERKEWESLLAAADAQPAGKREFTVGARGSGEISRRRAEEQKEKKDKKWLFPAGIGMLNQDVDGEGQTDILTLFGVLYRFTDTFYAGITPGISFGGDFGAFISMAWTGDPDLFINSFSFFAIPSSDFVMFGAFYNMAYRRFYLGPMVWVNSNLDRFSSGLFAGYYF